MAAPLIYDTLQDAFSLFKQRRGKDVSSQVPSLQTLAPIGIKMITRTPDSMTVQFINLGSAVGEMQDIPRLKQILSMWLRGLYNVQAGRGTTENYEVILTMKQDAPPSIHPEQQPVTTESIVPRAPRGGLVFRTKITEE